VGLFVVVVDFVNAFGFVPLHVLKPAMRINVSINMLFGIAACYSRESAPAMPISSGATRTTDGIPRSARRHAREHPVAAQRWEKIVREIKQVYEVRPRCDKRGAGRLSLSRCLPIVSSARVCIPPGLRPARSCICLSSSCRKNASLVCGKHLSRC
jgi:hypothetical protein